MSTLLGSTSDGRTITYDASLYEFSIDGELTAFADVQTLDTRNWIRWRAPQLRDWFRHIVPEDLHACNKRARAERASGQAAQQKAQSSTAQVAARVAVAQAAAQAAAHQRAQVAANSKLEYRSEDVSVASVDDQGIVRIVGPGSAGIYARRVGPGGSGPEMRVVTVTIEESDLNGKRSKSKTQKHAKETKALKASEPQETEQKKPAELVEAEELAKPALQVQLDEQPAIEVQMQPKMTRSMPLVHAASWDITSKEPAGSVDLAEDAPKANAEDDHAADSLSIKAPVMKITSNAVQSYKSKGGVLAKDKQFQLAAHMGYPPVFHKLEGSPFIEVSPDGLVYVRKGLKSGLYTAKVVVAPADGRQISKGEVIAISVKIR